MIQQQPLVIAHRGAKGEAPENTLAAYSLHPHEEWMTPAYAAEAARQGMKVYPWTVNEEPRFREMLAAGVSGIITDYPGRLRRILDNAGSPVT